MRKIEDDRITSLHRDAPLTDVHVHPSLKAYLFNRNLWRHYLSGKSWNPLASRSDFEMLVKGGVRVVWAAHYLPEEKLFADCPLARLGARLLVPGSGGKLSGGRFPRLLAMMDALEREISRHSDRAELARSAADVRRITGENKIALVHHIEGSHALSFDVGERLDPERIAHNLDVLADRGVAMITLSHFYPNGLTGHVDGVPKDMFLRRFWPFTAICDFDFGIEAPPLTDEGRALLRKLASLPMLVDVAHSSPAARAEIYAELGADRPIVASHVGVQALNPDDYNLGDDEIRFIAGSGGLIGVIFLTYWLHPKNPKNGLMHIWETLEHINHVTGSWDHVALGTDFDGFTDPPDDVRDASYMPLVTQTLLDNGVREADVLKILGGNAQRVLEAGWR